MRHEEAVRDQFQPGECKSWVADRLQLSEEVSHVK
jgi:hypothetical protein